MITVDDVNAVLAKSHPLLGQRRKIDWDKHDHVEGAYADVFGREREFRYASTRPVAAPGLEVVTQHGPQWFYGSRKPIPPAMVVRFGLQPFDRALAQFVFDASVAMRKPIELAKSDRVKRGDYVHTLFRNPSGAWQLSYFEVGFGAAGHRESQDPVDLVKETLAEGFRHWLEGAVDRSLAVQQQRSNPDVRRSPGTATVLRELRSGARGHELSDRSRKVAIKRAVLVRLSPPLRGAEYVVLSHCVVDGVDEYAAFPSTAEGRWPTRLMELDVVHEASSMAAALQQLGYSMRDRSH